MTEFENERLKKELEQAKEFENREQRQAEEIERLREVLTDLRDNLLEAGHGSSWMVRDINAALRKEHK